MKGRRTYKKKGGELKFDPDSIERTFQQEHQKIKSTRQQPEEEKEQDEEEQEQEENEKEENEEEEEGNDDEEREEGDEENEDDEDEELTEEELAEKKERKRIKTAEKRKKLLKNVLTYGATALGALGIGATIGASALAIKHSRDKKKTPEATAILNADKKIKQLNKENEKLEKKVPIKIILLRKKEFKKTRKKLLH